MTEFVLNISTKVYFGTGITQKALEKEKESLFGKNVMIVTTGRSLSRYGYVDKLKEILCHIVNCKNVIVYDNVSQNPRLKEIEEASHIGKEKEIQLVIGLGGGSALDAAKAVAAGIVQPEQIEDMLIKGVEPSEQTLPIIAIPTTAGTGSELSRAAIVTSDRLHIKGGIRGEKMIPKIAIVDAEYTWTVPYKITMETGFDVLAHAVESYVVAKADLFSEMLSEHVIKIVGETLLKLADNLDNHDAREKMCFASMLMGINLANVGTALPHRMQYPIGAATDTSHGAGLIALYPAWVEHEYGVNRDKVNNILKWLNYEPADTGLQARQVMKDIIQRLDIDYSLQTLGINENMLAALAENVTGNIANDILSQQPGIMEVILKESL